MSAIKSKDLNLNYDIKNNNKLRNKLDREQPNEQQIKDELIPIVVPQVLITNTTPHVAVSPKKSNFKILKDRNKN